MVPPVETIQTRGSSFPGAAEVIRNENSNRYTGNNFIEAILLI
jgi:hypothetical protein